MSSSEHDEDDRLDATLRAYLATELDGQLGRAARAFQDEARFAPANGVSRPRTLRSHAWTLGAIGAAVAASMAAMWVVPLTPPDGTSAVVTEAERAAGVVDAVVTAGGRDDGAGVAPPQSAERVAPRWQQVEKVVNSMTIDDGLVLLDDDTPARLVRQVAMERVEWVDERLGVRVQATLPREGARLVRVDTY